MAVLEILTYPDERLRKKAAPVAVVDDETKKLVDDMAETMYGDGIGLAATQVGVMKRVIVIDVTYTDEHPNLIVLINPELVKKSGSCVSEEGCLSLPEIREDVERAEQVVVRALGRDGEPVEISADGLLATAIQHEMDHLDGVLLIDHLSFLKRQMISRELKKRKQEAKGGK
jgi:peptide deformylase